MPVIKKHIKPGTLILSDEWRGYLNIPSIADRSYAHLTVNHSQNFVNPRSKVHTQNIENLWRNLKQNFKRMLGVHETMLESHIDEFLWRQQFGKTPSDAFVNILSDIADWYSV